MRSGLIYLINFIGQTFNNNISKRIDYNCIQLISYLDDEFSINLRLYLRVVCLFALIKFEFAVGDA